MTISTRAPGSPENEPPGSPEAASITAQAARTLGERFGGVRRDMRPAQWINAQPAFPGARCAKSSRRDQPDRLLEILERLRSGAVRGRDRLHVKIVRRDDTVEVDRLLGGAPRIARIVVGGGGVAIAPVDETVSRHEHDHIGDGMAPAPSLC